MLNIRSGKPVASNRDIVYITRSEHIFVRSFIKFLSKPRGTINNNVVYNISLHKLIYPSVTWHLSHKRITANLVKLTTKCAYTFYNDRAQLSVLPTRNTRGRDRMIHPARLPQSIPPLPHRASALRNYYLLNFNKLFCNVTW